MRGSCRFWRMETPDKAQVWPGSGLPCPALRSATSLVHFSRLFQPGTIKSYSAWQEVLNSRLSSRRTAADDKAKRGVGGWWGFIRVYSWWATASIEYPEPLGLDDRTQQSWPERLALRPWVGGLLLGDL